MTDDDTRRACERLILDSAAHNDAADWDSLGELYAEDAVLVRPNGQALEGRDAIVESYASTPATRMTRHACTNIRIDITGTATAVGHTLVLLFVADPAEEDSGPRACAGPAVGAFEDHFRRTRAGWRIERRTATVDLRPGS